MARKKPHSETLWIVKRFPQKGTSQKKPWFGIVTLRWDRAAAQREADEFVTDDPPARVVRVLVSEIPAKKPSKKARKSRG